MRLEWLVGRQAGVVSLDQARAAGLSDRTVHARAAAGAWRRVHPRVYAVHPGQGLTDEGRVWAAVLWAGAGAALSGPAAAWWHGLLSAAPLEVEVTRDRASRRRPGVRVRPRRLGHTDLVEVRGMTLTDVPFTVLETAVTMGAAGPAFLDRALQRAVGYRALVAAHHRNLGRHGSRAAGRLLAEAGDRAASRAERELIRLLRRARLTGWTTGYAVGNHLLDVAFPRARLAVEVDGWAWHSDVARFRADRSRQNALVLAGWTVLRFTWHDLTGRPDAVLAEITAALAAARTG